jgi:hypothetical protein
MLKQDGIWSTTKRKWKHVFSGWGFVVCDSMYFSEWVANTLFHTRKRLLATFLATCVQHAYITYNIHTLITSTPQTGAAVRTKHCYTSVWQNSTTIEKTITWRETFWKPQVLARMSWNQFFPACYLRRRN